jgi:hypothetical protein
MEPVGAGPVEQVPQEDHQLVMAAQEYLLQSQGHQFLTLAVAVAVAVAAHPPVLRERVGLALVEQVRLLVAPLPVETEPIIEAEAVAVDLWRTPVTAETAAQA